MICSFLSVFMYLRSFESSPPLERCVVILPNAGVAKENWWLLYQNDIMIVQKCYRSDFKLCRNDIASMISIFIGIFFCTQM